MNAVDMALKRFMKANLLIIRDAAGYTLLDLRLNKVAVKTK